MMCPSTHLCGDRLGAAPCEFDDDESNLWHIGKALFHRSHPFGASWSVGGTMPPARPPLASQPVSRLNTTLVFNFKHDRVVSRRATYLRAARRLASAEVGQGMAFT